jgi:hypothetical protein
VTTATSVHGFFNSGTWLVTRNLLVFFAVVFWIAFAYWVNKDARRRIEDPWLVGMATLLGLVPPYIGPFIYMLFRPPEYIEDVRERELEIKAMEERLAKRDPHCPVCRSEVDSSFLICRRSKRCGRCARSARPPSSLSPSARWERWVPERSARGAPLAGPPPRPAD